MHRVLFGIILCVVTGCWITNVSHVAGTLSKKDKKNKKGSEPSRAVSEVLLLFKWTYTKWNRSMGDLFF